MDSLASCFLDDEDGWSPPLVVLDCWLSLIVGSPELLVAAWLFVVPEDSVLLFCYHLLGSYETDVACCIVYC